MAADTDTVRRSRRSGADTREHILTVAGEAFYRNGIRATGVDTVAARAEVAPTTLYRLFASKDDLVAAYVERCAGTYRRRLTEAIAPTVGGPRERILAVFDAFIEEALSDSCRGCPFQLVLAEYPDPASLPHQLAVAHKEWLRALFHSLVEELALTESAVGPVVLAEGLTLVAEGIYGSVQSLGGDGPAGFGRECAALLLGVALAG
jgi:AcrR family transcriptional regulator